MGFVKYETLISVARTHNMSKTAQELHQTVPGVSYIINKLEEEWGIPLFVRNRGKLSLTEDCMHILPFVEDVLSMQNRLIHEIDGLKGAECGKVRLGGLKSVTKQWIPGIIKKVHEKYPNIEIEVVLNLYEEIQANLQNGIIDIALAGEPDSKQFNFHYLIDDPYAVLMPPDHPLADRNVLSTADIKGEELIMPDWKIDKDILKLISDNHLDEQISYRITDAGTIVSMVENGIGLSILPKFMCIAESANVHLAMLEDWPAKRFGIMTMDSSMLTTPVKKIIRCIEDWIKEEILEKKIP